MAVLVDPIDERTVDLEAVDRQSREIAQARIAGAEIVDRDLHAEGLQAFQDEDRLIAIVNEHALGELQLEPAWIELRRPQNSGDGLHEARAAELLRRNVYGKPQFGEPRSVPEADLATALYKREFAERVDEVAVLRDRDELDRRNPPALAVMPAHQDLDAVNTSVSEVDLGLVMDFQFASSKREAQFVFHFDPIGGLACHRRGVELEAVSAIGFDPVHRRFGVAQQDVELLAVSRVGARPETDRDMADRDVRIASLQTEGGPDGFLNLARYPERIVRAREIGGENREGVRSKPRDRVPLAHHAPQPVGDHFQQCIARSVAVAFVDELEPVQVEYEQCGRAAATPGMCNRSRMSREIAEKKRISPSRP